jgi:CxxC-x17-CxxC domain-containing protein
MGNFNRNFSRDSRSGGGRSFDRPMRDREMHRTTCSNCGKECEVPFKPNGSKPVFCSDCFEKNGGEQRRSNDRDYSAPRRSNFEDRRPSFNENRSYDRPQNFDRPQQSERPAQNNNAQFAELSSKLDRIITLLTPKPDYKNETSEAATESKESSPAVEKKPRAPRKPKAAPAEAVE